MFLNHLPLDFMFFISLKAYVFKPYTLYCDIFVVVLIMNWSHLISVSLMVCDEVAHQAISHFVWIALQEKW